MAGWSYKDWAGTVYPVSVKSAQWLGYLAGFFDLVEINTSFYGPIKPEAGREWCRTVAAVNPDFVFTAKLYRGFTHSPVAVVESTSAETIRPLPGDERDVKRGFDAIASEGRLRRRPGAIPDLLQIHGRKSCIFGTTPIAVLKISARSRNPTRQLEPAGNFRLAGVAWSRAMQYRPASHRAGDSSVRDGNLDGWLYSSARSELQAMVRRNKRRRPV